MALKMILNAHSTAVMAKLGKVVGNTMTNVSPSNLKLIGRATFLVQSPRQRRPGRPAWVRRSAPAARVLRRGERGPLRRRSPSWAAAQDVGQAAEVPVSIIRILESLRRSRGFTAEEALPLVQKPGLAAYLAEF